MIVVHLWPCPIRRWGSILIKSIIKKFILVADVVEADARGNVSSAGRDRPNPRINLYLIGVRCARAYLFGSAELGPRRSVNCAGQMARLHGGVIQIRTIACHDDGRCSRVRQCQRHGGAARSSERIGNAGAGRSPATAWAAFLSTFQCGASRAGSDVGLRCRAEQA